MQTINKIISGTIILLLFYVTIPCASATSLMPVNLNKVIDGDTISVNSNYDYYKVRFYGIDCAESSFNKRIDKQAKEWQISKEDLVKLGQKSTQILKDKIASEDVIYLKVMGVDYYGRMVAIPYKKEFLFFKTNLSEYMLTKGYCQAYIWKGHTKRRQNS